MQKSTLQMDRLLLHININVFVLACEQALRGALAAGQKRRVLPASTVIKNIYLAKRVNNFIKIRIARESHKISEVRSVLCYIS